MYKEVSNIIQNFCMKEINNIIKKYNKITNDEIKVIEDLFQNINNENLREKLYESFDNTIKLAFELDKLHLENKSEIISMYLSLSINTELNTTIENTIRYYEELKMNEYTLIDGYHLIYKNESDLKDITRIILDEMLDYEFHIDRLLDKDSIITYWLEGMTKDEVIEELIQGIEVEELLELNPIEIYIDNKSKYLYSEIEI